MFKELLEYIVKNLVQFPEQVKVEEAQEESKLILKLKVAKEDMGRVIGKEGRIIRSLREIMYSYAIKNGSKVTIEVEES
jgi:predicted RNA-binding protein YlqC (UPF0109 family)